MGHRTDLLPELRHLRFGFHFLSAAHPAIKSAGQRTHLCIAHALQVDRGQSRATAGFAVQHDGLIFVCQRRVIADFEFDHAARRYGQSVADAASQREPSRSRE